MTAPNDPQPPREDDPKKEDSPQERWFDALAGVIVTAVGLAALFGIMAFALTQLPSDESQGQNIVALSTSAFGVIGAIIGAFFGVRAANRAVDRMKRS
jgi:uncharacterized membrane protein YfcA